MVEREVTKWLLHENVRKGNHTNPMNGWTQILPIIVEKDGDLLLPFGTIHENRYPITAGYSKNSKKFLHKFGMVKK